MEANGLPSRTSILTAVARAFGSREPDASVRNPDWPADRVIVPAELALIAGQPIGNAPDQDFQEAIYNPHVFGLAWLMPVRTRFIDDPMERAVRRGARRSGLGRRAPNVEYDPIDFARESLGEALPGAGFQPGRKSYYICEGVSMYVPEEGMKEPCARIHQRTRRHRRTAVPLHPAHRLLRRPAE